MEPKQVTSRTDQKTPISGLEPLLPAQSAARAVAEKAARRVRRVAVGFMVIDWVLFVGLWKCWRRLWMLYEVVLIAVVVAVVVRKRDVSGKRWSFYR